MLPPLPDVVTAAIMLVPLSLGATYLAWSFALQVKQAVQRVRHLR